MSEIVINGVTLTKTEAQQYLDGMSVEEIIEAREAEIREKEEKEIRLAELSEWFNKNKPKKMSSLWDSGSWSFCHADIEVYVNVTVDSDDKITASVDRANCYTFKVNFDSKEAFLDYMIRLYKASKAIADAEDSFPWE